MVMLKKEDGYALIFVMIILSMFSIIFPVLLNLSYNQFCISRNYEAAIKDHFLINGVVNILLQDIYETLKEKVNKQGYIRKKDLSLLSKKKTLRIDGVTIKYEIKDIVDESSKININKADKKILKSLQGVGDLLAQEIISNRNFKAIEEITKVKGIGEVNSPSYQKIKRYITIHSDKRININTAEKLVLESLTGISSSLAQRIINHRPFDRIEELTEINGIGEKTYSSLSDYIKASSKNFTVSFLIHIKEENIKYESSRILTID